MSKERDPLFSSKNKKILKSPLIENNPITIQVLGVCSALAVTSQLKPSLVMGASVMVVLILSNVVVSLLRKLIPAKIRIIVEMTVELVMHLLLQLLVFLENC